MSVESAENLSQNSVCAASCGGRGKLVAIA